MYEFERTEEGDGIVYALGNIKFQQPKLAADPEVACAFDTSLSKFADVRLAVDVISKDDTLSPIGKEQKQAKPLAEGISHLAGAWWHVSNYAEGIARRENGLFAVPQLESSYAAEAIIDREVRDFYRSLPPGERVQMLAQMHNEPTAHQRVQLAMLRSPIALLEGDAKILNEVWREGKRAQYPAEAAAIDHGRESIEWTRRGLAQLAGLFRSLHRLSDDTVLHSVLTDENPRRASGYGVFGMSDQKAERYGIKLQGMGYRKDAEGVWKKAR